MARLTKQSLDGNVETIILSYLLRAPNYGYGLVREINEQHEGLLRLGEGTIYPVLYRMEEKGFIASQVQKTASGRQRKYYRLSPQGRRALEENLRQWSSLAEVMQRIQEGLPIKPLALDNG